MISRCRGARNCDPGAMRTAALRHGRSDGDLDREQPRYTGRQVRQRTHAVATRMNCRCRCGAFRSNAVALVVGAVHALSGESLNVRFRQATRRRGHFPSEQAALEVLYLVIRSPQRHLTNVTGRTAGWKAALNTLAMFYGEGVSVERCFRPDAPGEGPVGRAP